MGFFTKEQSAGGQLAPLSRDRIAASLDARSANYGIVDGGDIGGYWDGHLFYFFVLGRDGEYLQVRARWNREIAIEQYARVLELVNDWNAEKLWPKGYVRRETAGEETEPSRIGVYAEHTVDYEPGLTDDQLGQHLTCAIATAGQLFDMLDEHYPGEAALARAEFERE